MNFELTVDQGDSMESIICCRDEPTFHHQNVRVPEGSAACISVFYFRCPLENINSQIDVISRECDQKELVREES